jgi:hypothetical protein
VQPAVERFVREAVVADDPGHLLDEALVVAPLLLEGLADAGFGLGVDQVDADRLGLLETLDAVDRLDEVGELEADTGEDRPVTVALEVAAGPCDDGLGRQVLDLAVGEIDDRALALVEVLGAPDADDLGDRGRDRAALGLKVVPEQEVLVGRGVEYFAHLRDARGDRGALLRGRGLDAQARVAEQLAAAVAAELRILDLRGRHLVPDDLDRRQLVALVGVAEIGRPLQEERPGRDPHPELVLHVRQQRQLVGVLAVALEEPRLGLPDVEDVQERGVGEQLDEVVRRRRRRGHEAVVGGPLVETHELAEGLRAAEPAQDRCLVEADDVELARVELALAHGLVVGEVDPVRRGLVDAADERRLDADQAPVAHELLAHAERTDDQAAAAAALGQHEAFDLELLQRLAEPERLEQGAPTSADRPCDRVALVRLQDRVDLVDADLEPVDGRDRGLGGQELLVGPDARLLAVDDDTRHR